MIKRILEQDDVPRAFCELVYEKTRGNPFFVEEVINSLKEDKIIYREEDKWKIKDVSRIEFPETVKSVIKKRISQLDDECQHILTMTSFVGKDCSFEALCGVTGVEENKLLEIMDRILKTGLIKENVVRGEDVYSFTDIIVRDVVHEEVSHLRHKKLHSAVGCALEKVYAEKIDEHFGELAYHFLEGGDKDKALDYFLKAAEKAQNVYAHNEAISYLQHALGLLKEKEGNLGEESRIMERLGDIKARVGEIDDCMEYWNKSLALWDQLGDRKSVSRIHAKMANVFWRFTGDREKASEHHQKALEILESEPESVELANLYLDISFMLWSYGTIAEKALPWAKKALVLSERLGYTGVLLGCTHMLAGTSWASGELEKASKYYENGLKIALEKNLAEAAIGLYINLSTFYFQIGEWQKAFENAQKASELAKKAGEVEGISGTEFNLALCYWGIGEIWKGISLVKEVLALDKRANNERGIATSLLGLGACYLRLGEWDKSLQYLKEALDTAKKVGETRTTDWANEFLGELFMEMEDYVEAEKYLDESKRICNEEGDTHSKLSRVFPALSKLYLKKEEIEKAKALIEKTYEYATITRNRFFTSYADMLNAMVFREQKNWEQSIQNFEKSIQGHKALNAQKWYVDQYADLLYEYGLMYLARNEEGDKEKAYSLLNQALEIYQKIDAKKKIEKVIAKRKFLTA
jgi:tetratricopeptide (TPR) repeat protein